MTKKYKESNIVKKCLGWIYLTGHTLYSRAKTRRYALQWNDKT